MWLQLYFLSLGRRHAVPRRAGPLQISSQAAGPALAFQMDGRLLDWPGPDQTLALIERPLRSANEKEANRPPVVCSGRRL